MREQDFIKLLETMDIPQARVTDYRWLARNIGIRNSNHPGYPASITFIKEKLRKS